MNIIFLKNCDFNDNYENILIKMKNVLLSPKICCPGSWYGPPPMESALIGG